MKKRNKNTSTLPVLLFLFIMAGCSVTANLPENQQLYAGLKGIEVKDEDKSKFGQSALASAEKPLKVKPNNALFNDPSRRSPLPSFGLFMYNKFVNDNTALGKWFFKKFAAKPIFISDVNPSARATVAQNILHEYGYFNAEIQSEVIPSKKDSLEAKVRYTIHMGTPYIYDSIEYLPPIHLHDSTVLDHSKLSQLHKGDNFSLDGLVADRKEISNKLRDYGFYFFRPNDVAFEADTLIAPGKVQVRTLLPANLPRQSRMPWQIGRIELQMRNRQDVLQNRELKDSVLIDSAILVRFNDGLPIRKNVLKNRIMFRPGDFFNQTREGSTLTALSALGTFSSTRFVYTPRNTEVPQTDTVTRQMEVLDKEGVKQLFLPYSDAGKLDLEVRMMQDKLWDVSIEALYKVKSNNYMGPGLNLGLARHNIFKGGEVLSLDLYGSYEWQTGKSPFDKRAFDINTYQFGADLSLKFPALLMPVLSDRYLNGTARTTFTLGASVLNRANFFRMNSFGFGFIYDFNVTPINQHSITPLRINYNMLSSRSREFDQLMDENPALRLSLQSQLIVQNGYTYTFDNIPDSRMAHHIWFRVGVSQAGNLLNLFYKMAGKPYNDTKKLMGVPFAQFVKGTGELRYTYTIDRNQSLAMRVGGGIIYSYGNMIIPPYSEQFYVGGANSIRAFTVRSLGPGSFKPDLEDRYGFIDQTGSVKLEANLEYRGKLIGNLHGAVFLDSGNVWLLRRDDRRPGGSLREISSTTDFFKQIALGTGVGLRYDLSFLVVRFDAGIGLHLPYETSKKGYYNIPRFKDGLAYHLAIGYPF